MTLYRNPDFRRPPSGLAAIFNSGPHDSFFALAAWYDLMARCGVPPATEIRAYTDERPGSAAAILVQAAPPETRRTLASLTNAHSLEHGMLCAPSADVAAGLAAIVAEIIAERPQWDCLSLAELDPRAPAYGGLTGALRRAGYIVECTFSSGTWYEETAGLSFADYLAARPSELRNTWRRKRRKLERGTRLTKSFFADDREIDRAVADYQTVYAASWRFVAIPWRSSCPSRARSSRCS